MAVRPDPVHLLFAVEPRLRIAAVVRKIKGYTADTIRKAFKYRLYLNPAQQARLQRFRMSPRW
jgi:REP element-mobilizing transposase RayT